VAVPLVDPKMNTLAPGIATPSSVSMIVPLIEFWASRRLKLNTRPIRKMNLNTDSFFMFNLLVFIKYALRAKLAKYNTFKNNIRDFD
jgi:hypothetical protein